MSNFEEQYTAWIDGKLSGPELEKFEALLENRAEADQEKVDTGKLGALLRTHGKAPEMRNAAFFNEQLLRQIEAEQPASAAPTPTTTPSAISLWRMVFASAACLLAAVLVFEATVPHTPRSVPTGKEFLARVLNAKPGEGVSASTFQLKNDKVAVLWLEGLDYQPDPDSTPADNGK